AEDGIRDKLVTGVQTCALPIWSRFWEMPEEQWQLMLDVNLGGVWRTFKASAPILIEQGRGGSIVAISSVAGLKALPGQAHYTARSEERRVGKEWGCWGGWQEER